MILFRLIRDKKVVGYEKHENGRIYHCNRMVNIKGVDPNWDNIFTTGCYIPHDRKDRYTGVDVDGVKLFERDEIKLKIEIPTFTRTIKDIVICDILWQEGSGKFQAVGVSHKLWFDLDDLGIDEPKIIGIQGVDDEQ